MLSNKIELLLLISIFRHGQRTPMINFQTNQHEGIMTEEHLKNTSSIGSKFYQRFNSHLSQSNFPKDSITYISDSMRTIKSALYRSECLNADKSFKIINENELKNYTIDNLNSVYDPYMFSGFLICPIKIQHSIITNNKYIQLQNEINEKLASHKLFEEYINSSALNQHEKNSFFRLLLVLDYFATQDPNSFSNDEIAIIKHLHSINAYKRLLDLVSEDENIKIVFVNRLLSQLLQDIDDVILGKSNKRLILVSGHDFTLSTILHALGVNRDKYFYSYNDEINIKLIKDNDKYFIQIEYNDEPLSFIKTKSNDSNQCSIAEFKKLIYKYNGYSNEQVLNYCNDLTTFLSKESEILYQDL